MKQKILLDTNFLMIPFQFNVDIFSELKRVCDFKYDLYILDRSVDELNTLIDRDNSRTSKIAKMALQLKRDKDIKVIKTIEKKHTDDLILEKKGFIVATRDMNLIRKLNENSKKYITLRQKKYLILNNS
ncbi:MAG: PIN domain-containing protein [Candidatus Woesearchaeota archaeon]